MERIDCVVIGAGVVGLACARALALAGREVVIVEAQNAIGTETSARNSEVIHGGLYYPNDSLRARFCVAGKQRMYEYCAERGIPHRRIEKLVIAIDDDELPAMEKLMANAARNGVDDLQALDVAQARRLEPALACAGAFLSPSTGIVDSHSLMLALLGEAEDHGAMLALSSPVIGGEVRGDGILLRIGGEEPMDVLATTVVNAAGLYAQKVSAAIEGIPAATIPPIHYARGVYFTLTGKAPFTRLIYPMPVSAWLGVHLTLDLGGAAKFGPDIEWVDGVEYVVDPGRVADFYPSIRRWWPGLKDGVLQPGYAGVRPKLYAKGEPAADFVVQNSDVHSITGLINLYGIESPGLTSSIAIGEYVAELAA
ncbi:MAG: NAD(P)/FAD-dependent oxidoreductase [Rhodospirillales bacterium]